MDSAVLLAHLSDELDSFAACAGGLSRPVRHCGSWTLFDLASHLGRENQWVVTAVVGGRGDFEAPNPPEEPVALARWLDGTAAQLLSALGQDPGRPAWTIYPPHTVGFWRRRRAIETAIHRWDAELALGRAGVLDPELAVEGVAEVVDTMFPRQVSLGRTVNPDQSLRLRLTNAAGSRVLGPGEPAATVSGTAQSLLLLLWHRLGPDDPGLTWEGDLAAGRAALDRPVTP